MKGKRIRKSLKLIIPSLFLGGLVSISADAYGELLTDITYRCKETIACVELYNYYTNSRYCEVSIRTGQTRNSATTCAFRSADVSSESVLRIDADVFLEPHVWGGGVIYNSLTPYSGIAWTDEDQLK